MVARVPLLFPSFVFQRAARYELAEDVDLAARFPGTELPRELAGAVRKRQAEFLAGRSCAREALRACAPEHAGAQIGVGDHHEPIWPDGIVGTITHAQGIASAAVARAAQARGLGLDAEPITSCDRAEQLLPTIAAPDEIDAIVRQTRWTIAIAFTAAFSTKEAASSASIPPWVVTSTSTTRG